MNKAKAHDIDNTEEKHLYASGDTVFTRRVKGEHGAELYGEPVTLYRVRHNYWECIDDTTKEVLGAGPNRNVAMREAFYTQAQRQGYDQDEADRLNWILVPQKYRSYGGHKPRRKSVIPIKREPQGKVVAIDRKRQESEKIERAEGLLEQYKTAYNEALGGWLYYRRDPVTRELNGIKGPFDTEKEMMEEIFGEITSEIAS